MKLGTLVVVLGIGLVVVGWLGMRAIGERHVRTELREAQRDLREHRPGAAKSRLARLATQWPGRGDVMYWLRRFGNGGGPYRAGTPGVGRRSRRCPGSRSGGSLGRAAGQ